MFRDMLENQEVEDKREEYIQEFKSTLLRRQALRLLIRSQLQVKENHL